MNLFVNSKSSYKRNFEILDAWVRDMTATLQLSTGQPKEVCEAFIRKEMVPGGRLHPRDPRTTYLERLDCDRSKHTGSLMGYIRHIVNTRSIMAPSMTVYFHPSKLVALLGKYIVRNLDIRNMFKKDMFAATMRNDVDGASFNKNMQTSFKYKNNSLSGAQVSGGTVLANKSAHPSLTSTCRVSASYGNANNEKFLAGNRHYWSPTVTIANVVSLANNTDLAGVENAMKTFGLRYPSVDEAMECVLYSSRLYWNDAREEAIIRRLFVGMSDVQRAAVVYVSDMYHLAKYNTKFVHDFLGAMISIPKTPIDNPEDVLKSVTGDIVTLSSYLCAGLMSGRLLKDLNNPNSKKKDGTSCFDPETYAIVANTAKGVEAVLSKYQPIIKGFWTTPNLAPSIMHIPNMRRRCVLVSDTDSTIFTNQFWTRFYTGQDDWSETSNNVAYVTTFLASQTVMHVLACMSGHIGMAEKEIHRISMKNEFFFPVFVKTSMAKHYFAYISAQEGNVFGKMKLELKGKNLRDSTVAPAINQKVQDFVKAIMDRVMKEGQISTKWAISEVLAVENSIIQNIRNGNANEFTTMRLNDKMAYKNPESSNYRYHDLWNSVFAPKYGIAENPPYTAIKVSLSTSNRSRLTRWVNGIEDKELADRLRQWLAEKEVDSLAMMLLPPSIVAEKGVPEEIIPAIDYRGIVYSSCVAFYIVLEALGIYSVDDKKNRLLSDIYTETALV